MLLPQFTFLFLVLITRLVLEFFQVTSLKMTRHQKRKIDETHVEVGTGHKLILILLERGFIYSSPCSYEVLFISKSSEPTREIK